MVAGKFFWENNLLGLTPLISKVNKLLVSLYIGQHNAMEIFAVKWDVILETNKVLLNKFLHNLVEAVGLRMLSLTD